MRLAPVIEREVSGEQLVAKSKTGCLLSFEELVRRHQQPIYNYLLHLLHHPQDAEDAAQETFVKAFRSLHRYDDRHPFPAWLFAIAKHTALSHFRKARRNQPPAELQEQAVSPDVEGTAENLWRLARRLKPRQFEVLWLHYGEGFSLKEISRITGSNLIYVKVLLHRARTELKKKLEAADP